MNQPINGARTTRKQRLCAIVSKLDKHATSMKLLTCNTGYLLGYENVLWGYAPQPVNSLVGNHRVERRTLKQLVTLIDRERPDVVSLLEVDRGSHRTATEGQLQTLLDALDNRGLNYWGAGANKYAERGLVTALPFFGHLGNAVLARAPGSVTRHYLSSGRKRLVIELSLGQDAVLFMVHLSLGTRSRRRQLRELTDLIDGRADGRDVIVTGDFNTFDEPEVLETFAQDTGLDAQIPGETVPGRPLDTLFIDSRCIDLFFCSPSVNVDRCDVIDEQVSDHRPVVMETGA